MFYDQFKDVLLQERCSVSCALIQIEPKALTPLFYAARRWGADVTLAKQLAAHEAQRCRSPAAFFSEGGLFRSVLATCTTLYCRPFIQSTLRKAYKAVMEHLASYPMIALDRMSVEVPCALETFLTTTLDGIPRDLPREVVAIVHAFMRAAHAKFPDLKQSLFGAMAFHEIVCVALENPEKYEVYRYNFNPEIDFIMKTILMVFKSACRRVPEEEPKKADEQEDKGEKDKEKGEKEKEKEKEKGEKGEKESEENDDTSNSEQKKDWYDKLLADMRDDIIIAQSRIRSIFKHFVLIKNIDNNDNNGNDEWFSKREYEKHLLWIQMLLRSYPDKFKRYLAVFIQSEPSKDLEELEADDAEPFVESDAELISNSDAPEGTPTAEGVDGGDGRECPAVEIEASDTYKEATRLSFVSLHPRFDYHLKVSGTDHYISEDPVFTGRALGEWPLAKLYWEGSLRLEFDFVDNKEFDEDQYIATQIARIAGTEYRWSLLSDEAYLFSQVLYRAVPHVSREYPINRARTETTPFPPQLERTFVVVVFLPDGTASKTCKCDLETRTSELLGTISTKFFRDTKQMFRAEEIALKAVGKEQYLLPDDHRPVSSCSYIRDSLRKSQRPAFVIVERAGLVVETPFDVAFAPVAPPPPGAVSSLTVLRPLEVVVSHAACLGAAAVRGGHVFVEAAAYYGGRKISPLVPTAFESSTDQTGTLLRWNSSVSLGMQVPTIPREALLCFGLYHVDETGKRAALAWTSCRLFDHAARLIAGPHALPLLAGAPNPIGICVHAMGLQTSAQLHVVFPNYGGTGGNGTHPVVHFTCMKDDATATAANAIVPLSKVIESATASNLIKNTLLSMTDVSSKGANGTNGTNGKPKGRKGSFTAKLAGIGRSKNASSPRAGESPLAASSSPSTSPSSSLVRLISDRDEALLGALIEKDSLYVLTPDEQKLVWSHREYLRRTPLSIIKIAQSVPWVIPAAVRAMHRLLEGWPLIDPVRALELLDSKYPDARLREYAVRCIEQMGVDELDDYIMQLVQALKCETYHRSPLALFLLKAAINNRLPLGHTLFLMLKAEMHIPEVRERFTLFLKCYLRASGMHRDVIIRQLDLTDALMVANRNKSFQALENFPFCGSFFLPHDPTLCVSRLILEKCRVLGSARAPLWLAFENADKLAKEPICVLFKAADDLRQDMLALQVIKLMGKFWESEKLDMRLTLYKCVALGPAVGMIEVVPESTTIADIQKLMGGGVTSAFKEKTVAEWLRRKSPGKGVFEKEVVETFTYSLAGYCVATYLLGVGDRHNDNVMLKNDGHLFHIDYGHILGNAEMWNGIKRDRAPFVLTPEFVFVMGGKKSEGFARFCDVACEAYNVIRKYSSTFITLFTMMLSTDIPELRSEEDVYYLKTAFNTELSGKDADEKAKEFFRGLISQSLGTKMTRINNAIHIAVHPHINDAHDTNLN